MVGFFSVWKKNFAILPLATEFMKALPVIQNSINILKENYKNYSRLLKNFCVLMNFRRILQPAKNRSVAESTLLFYIDFLFVFASTEK